MRPRSMKLLCWCKHIDSLGNLLWFCEYSLESIETLPIAKFIKVNTITWKQYTLVISVCWTNGHEAQSVDQSASWTKILGGFCDTFSVLKFPGLMVWRSPLLWYASSSIQELLHERMAIHMQFFLISDFSYEDVCENLVIKLSWKTKNVPGLLIFGQSCYIWAMKFLTMLGSIDSFEVYWSPSSGTILL